jgi:hypothetical protein
MTLLTLLSEVTDMPMPYPVGSTLISAAVGDRRWPKAAKAFPLLDRKR